MRQRVLITGVAGFIGSNLAARILEVGKYDLVGIDNFSAPYGSQHCKRRANFLKQEFGFQTQFKDLSQLTGQELFDSLGKFDFIVHLAAWPGVRFGQRAPDDYYRNNVNAFGNILHFTNLVRPTKFLFASSSSVYGDLAEDGPVREGFATGNNLKSFYAATKWANEVLAAAYQGIFGVPTIALRFFTVYGPNGRPDMAYWLFLEQILKSQEISLFGKDGGTRNFTYIDDAVEILMSLLEIELNGYQPLNISSFKPISTIDMLKTLGSELGVPVHFKSVERPVFDVGITHADTSLLRSLVGEYRETSIETGLSYFVNWYKQMNPRSGQPAREPN